MSVRTKNKKLALETKSSVDVALLLTVCGVEQQVKFSKLIENHQ